MVPDAEQGISYAVPGFKVAGKTIAGFAAFKNHLSYLPHSGSVFHELAEELIAVRLRQAFPQVPGDRTGSSGATAVAKRR